jgi:hypothetical protein
VKSRFRSKDVTRSLSARERSLQPQRTIHLQKAAENGSLETIVKIKSSIPGAKIKEIIPVEKKQEATSKQS